MTVVLRLIGVMNAAVWFGGALFFSFGVAPAFFSQEMKGLFGEVYTGVIAQLVFERYFVLFYWCGAIAVVHLLAEWVYLGKPLHRLTLGILIGVYLIGLFGGLWLQPKLQRLHQTKYARAELVTPALRTQAARSFRIWHGVSEITNLLALGGLAVYTWRVSNPPNQTRFSSAAKFRS